ncbi:MAG: hypothetical protein WCZ28_06270 [Burkholderiaceae bacterium]
MIRFGFLPFPLFNPEGAGGGGGAGGADGGDGGDPGSDAGAGGLAGHADKILNDGDKGGQGDGGGQGGDDGKGGDKGGKGDKGGQDGQPYFPDGLPEMLRGTNDRETIDKLTKEISGRPQPPATPDEYKLELPEDLAKKVGDLENDQVLKLWRGVAHELGLSNAQFQDAFVKLHEKMSEAGLLEEPVDYDQEIEKLAPKAGDPKVRMQQAAQRVNAIANTVKDWQTRGVIDKSDAVILSLMYATADSVKAFEKVMKLIPGEHGVQGGGAGGGDGLTDHERAMRAMFPSMVNAS